MEIKKIIELEDNNKDTIYLFKAGVFWRAYNYSAMRFCAYLQPYKVSAKYIKKVKQNIYYCGFPDTSLDKIISMSKINGYDIFQINEKQIAIKIAPSNSPEGGENQRTSHTTDGATGYISSSFLKKGREGLEVEEDYDKWKEQYKVPIQDNAKKDLQGFQNLEGLIKKLREFPLENSTPLQTMMFVQELKKNLSLNPSPQERGRSVKK